MAFSLAMARETWPERLDLLLGVFRAFREVPDDVRGGGVWGQVQVGGGCFPVENEEKGEGGGASQCAHVCQTRDGPNTTATIILQKSFAPDATSERHVMAHQMKNLCVFSVFHCVERAFGAASGGTPQ